MNVENSPKTYEELKKFKVKELKDILRNSKLKISGKKDELINRILKAQKIKKNDILLKAISNNNIEQVKEIIKSGVDLNIQNKNGVTPLMASENFEITKLLLENGADPNLQTQIGNTALMILTRLRPNYLDILNLLLENGADPNIKNSYAESALYIAVDRNKIGLVKLLLENGADPNIVNSAGSNPLFNTDNLEILKLLLENGADPNFKDYNGNTPLSSSLTVQKMKLLLENGADPFEKDGLGRYPIDKCNRFWEPSSDNCRDIVSKYMWEKINENIRKLSKQFSRSGDFPLSYDVWELILLRRRQQQFCKNLSSNENKDLLKYFAISLELPISDNMSKRQLCARISEQLVFGRWYNSEAKEFTEKRIQKTRKTIFDLAYKLGINPNQSADKILDEISSIMNIKL